MRLWLIKKKEKFFISSPEFSWNSWLWQIFPERLQTPGGYGFGQQTCHTDGFPLLQQHPELWLLWIFFFFFEHSEIVNRVSGLDKLFLCDGGALKWCQPSSMDEGFEKGTMNWKKKGKNPSYLGNKTKGRRENVEEREKNRWGGWGGVTGWPSLLSIPQPILSPRTERQAFLVLRSDREKGRDEKKREKESESLPKRGREQERREWQGGGMEGEQLESLSSAPSRWIGLMNASECWGAMASSIKAGNTAQI